jgi:hypothetical protein
MWNWALASIPAYDLTMLQNIMLIEIALFSLAFLQESLTLLMVTGMALVLLGVFMVQVRGSAFRTRPGATAPPPPISEIRSEVADPGPRTRDEAFQDGRASATSR